MQRIGLEIYTTVEEAVRVIKEVADYRVELDIPLGSVLFENVMNLKMLNDQAKRMGKELTYSTEDPFGRNLINLMKSESSHDLNELRAEQGAASEYNVVVDAPGLLEKIRPRLALSQIALPKVGIVVGITLILLAGAGFIGLTYFYKAHVTLYFTPQVLTKSVSIEVGDGYKTAAEKKTLSGLRIVSSVENTLSYPTTGSKIEGNYAKGKVTIYNSTTSAVELMDGTELRYKPKDTTYAFTLDDNVSVPAREDDPANPGTIIKGSATAKITAKAVGDDFNIDKGEELSIKGRSSEDLKAVSSEDFKGGSSKVVKVVAQKDIDGLKAELTKSTSIQAQDLLKPRVPSGFQFVDKSGKITEVQISIDKKVGEETDQLKGVITAQAEGLTYSQKELAKLIDAISQGLVPAGFDFRSLGGDIKVDVLGETENTQLSSTLADVQVTFKLYIVPNIDENAIANDIKGKSFDDTLAVLAKINGVAQTALKVTPNITFLHKMPFRSQNIVVEVTIQE